MANAAFGLDIGTSNLKSVWFEQKREVVVVKAAFASKAPVSGMTSSSAIDEEQMAKAIRDHVTEAKIGTRNVHIALADNLVYTKVVEMPMLSDKELEQAIFWEAEQYIPAPLSTIMLDHVVLRKNIQSSEGMRMEVLLVGAPTVTLQKYQKIVEMSGLSVASIETEMLASVRAIVTSSTFPISLIVNIGNLNTSLAIVQQGVIVFAYTVPIGSVSITRAIASDFGFTPEQADEYKKAYGIADPNVGAKIKRSIEPILTSLVGEVKKALAFYVQQYRGELPVTQVILSGGTAKLPGIDAFFVNSVGLETVVANPWQTLRVEGIPQVFADQGPEFTVAIGLGLKGNEH
ncbi:MAG: hypothetical protein RLZZ455_378 [Candidatus Parcubacteria bacterium]|jgi:type IV pilus assembly protein PilM